MLAAVTLCLFNFYLHLFKLPALTVFPFPLFPLPSPLRVAASMIVGTMIIGQLASLSPNYNAGIVGAARIFAMLDRVPRIDSSEEFGKRPVRDGSGAAIQIF